MRNLDSACYRAILNSSSLRGNHLVASVKLERLEFATRIHSLPIKIVSKKRDKSL